MTERLHFVLAASRRLFALSLLCGAAAGGASAALMSFITRAIEETTRSSTLPLLYFSFCIGALATSAASVTLLSRMAQANQHALRLSLARRILATPLAKLQACGPHRSMAALTEDVASIVGAQSALPHLFIEGAKLLGAFAYIGLLSPTLLMVVLGFVAVGVVSYRLLQRRAMIWFARAREADSILYGHFRAITEGHKELKMDARRRRAFLDEELFETSDMARQRLNKANLALTIATNWSESLYYLVIGLVLFVAPLAEDIPRATLTGFSLTILFIGGPLSTVFSAAPALVQGRIALKNLEAMGFGEGAELQAPPSPPAARPATLTLRDVSYRHPGEMGENGSRVGPISLIVPPGQLLFVTGGNGGGKTTLGLLLLGLYTPDAGEIRLGDETITDAVRDAYRQNFSAVFADSYLFETLMGYGSAEGMNRARELLALLRLDDRVGIADGRFSTTDLSRGQRKRLALLAALLEDRPFYLFDEWAAEQDPAFRETFYLELLPQLKARGKTVIVITHDDRYFHLCDRLLRLSSGEIDLDRENSSRTSERMEVDA